MDSVRKVEHCRISGEKLSDGRELFSIDSCPLPGIYPVNPRESLALRVPLSVVQAKQSRLVQLAHRLDPSVYTRYAFSGSVSAGYTRHQTDVADKIRQQFDADSLILEIGCGDGYLLKRLHGAGWRGLYGIEPSRLVRKGGDGIEIVRGFFPDDIPPAWRKLKFDLILLRQVLEHIESPVGFVKELPRRLKRSGQIWIEVPDLISTLDRKLFSNFYPLHCSYFTSKTLNALMARAGLAPVASETVEVFGGSILSRYVRAPKRPLPRTRDSLWDMRADLSSFTRGIARSAKRMPANTAGYGAAERTAALMGLCPSLEDRVSCLYDRNPLLHNRYLGGTALRIRKADFLFRKPPAGLILFAVSHKAELLAEFARRLPGKTTVMIADYSAKVGRLDEIAAVAT